VVRQSSHHRKVGVTWWGEWVDELTDRTPADGWCVIHGPVAVDVARMVTR